MIKSRVMSLTISMIMLYTGACAPVISKGLREQAARDITFSDVFRDPDAFKGKILILGGIIIKTENQKEGTLIELLQKPTDSQGKPRDTDESGGRLLALYDGFLDGEIYSQGREVTLAGEIEGKRVQTLGAITYSYPLLSIREIYLWPEKSKERYYYPYPFPYWHYPPSWDSPIYRRK